ncbi:MAG: ABC transporter ATP-binding protein [Phycisphaerales bacterium]
MSEHTSQVEHRSGEPIVEAVDVRKTYRLGRMETPVLRGASVRVMKGEWVAVLGASGSGKSTLLHLLGGLDRPDRAAQRCVSCGAASSGAGACACGGRVERVSGGEVRHEGVSLVGMEARGLDRVRRFGVGFVFQFYHLLPELNVEENVLVATMSAHGRAGYARVREEARARAASLLEAFGLAHRLRHRPTELSGGERQRVAIARALINEPPVLLADEPTGNLDRVTGASILDALAALHRERAQTMVVVTHDETVAARADRVVRLRDGRVVEE